jgi:hypothetical protein
MSAFHRVGDIRKLDGPTFFKLAYRLESYQGAVAAAAARETGEGPVVDAGLYQPTSDLSQVEVQPESPALTAEQLTAMFPAAPQIGQEVGLFEIAQVKNGS